MLPTRMLISLLPFLALGVIAAPANKVHKRLAPGGSTKKCKRPSPSPAQSDGPAPPPVLTGTGTNTGGDSAVNAGTGAGASVTGSSAAPPAPTGAASGNGTPAPALTVTPAPVSSGTKAPAPTGTGNNTGNTAGTSGGKINANPGDLGEVPVAPANLTKAPLGKEKRFVGYWSVDHGMTPEKADVVWPEDSQLKGLTHLVLGVPLYHVTPPVSSFIDADKDFKAYQYSWATNWPKDSADQLRQRKPGLKVMGAFGGWGGDAYFRKECSTDAGRQGLAKKMLDSLTELDLDGIDLDWEFPVGNGAVYKEPGQENNPYERFWFIDLVYKIRAGLPEGKLLTSAIPGREADLSLAFDTETVPALEKGLDWFNLMTYDIMNRRDHVAAHHSGGAAMLNTIKLYKDRGMTPEMMNIGFPMYAKWFKAGPAAKCDPEKPIGCDFGEYTFESQDGKDMGNSAPYVFNEALMTSKYLGPGYAAMEKKIQTSWDGAKAKPIHDAEAMATTAWDKDNGIFWTWLSDKDVEASCNAIIKDVGGVMAWSIDQDDLGGKGGPRFDALQKCLSAA